MYKDLNNDLFFLSNRAKVLGYDYWPARITEILKCDSLSPPASSSNNSSGKKRSKKVSNSGTNQDSYRVVFYGEKVQR